MPPALPTANNPEQILQKIGGASTTELSTLVRAACSKLVGLVISCCFCESWASVSRLVYWRANIGPFNAMRELC
eukprot:1256516-Amphidinium_carterae.1